MNIALPKPILNASVNRTIRMLRSRSFPAAPFNP